MKRFIFIWLINLTFVLSGAAQNKEVENYTQQISKERRLKQSPSRTHDDA